MIEEIKIRNIQSHKDTTLNFSNGINALTGSSNNGKTAILRALNWCINNRPTGTDVLCSHWALDKKGNIKPDEEMSVTVKVDGNTVTRRRTKNENQYIVNGKVLNVVKTDVPDEVSAIFRMSATSIQNQMDSPFLLGETSGEVARYLNKVVHLDVIDRVLSNAESARRKNKSEFEYVNKDFEEAQERLKSFEWINDCERDVLKCESLDSEMDEVNGNILVLAEFIKSLSNLESFSEFEHFDEAKKDIKKLDELNQDIIAVEKDIGAMESAISRLTDSSILTKYEDIKLAIIEVRKIERLTQKIDELSDEYYAVSDSLKKLKEESDEIEDLEDTIEKLNRKLPSRCPYCNSIIK